MGQLLLWTCNQSWPICFDAPNIASIQYQKTASKELVDINKSINKVEANPYGLKFHSIDKDAMLVV